MADETTPPTNGTSDNANAVPVPAISAPQSQPTAPTAPVPLEIPANSPPANPDTTPLTVPVPQTGKLGADIAQILKGVKLPERRNESLPAKKVIENKAATFDTALGTAVSAEKSAEVISPELTTPSPVSAAPKTDPTPSSVVSVHTLKDDLQHVVQDQKISVVRAASIEQDRRARGTSRDLAPEPAHDRSKRTAAILFAAVILLVLGAGALFGVYTVMRGPGTPASQAPVSSTILFAESSVAFPLDGQTPDTLKQSLAAARASLQGALGSITAIIPTVGVTNADGSAGKRPATFSEFMQALGAHPPDALLRALGSNFFFGIHTVDTNAPLFVIPVSSYDRAFAGMLAWEASMNGDLAPVFTAVPVTATDANGIPVNRTFQDVVIRNYDVRALKDDAGQIRLYYSFPSQNILVIAESPYSFAEILSRLQAQREL